MTDQLDLDPMFQQAAITRVRIFATACAIVANSRVMDDRRDDDSGGRRMSASVQLAEANGSPWCVDFDIGGFGFTNKMARRIIASMAAAGCRVTWGEDFWPPVSWPENRTSKRRG